MAKRKITVTIDEEVVEQAQALGIGPSLSAVVNEALASHVERLARLAALGELLDSWDDKLGPVPADAVEAARAAFDELDGITAGKQGAA
jgi:post-segregation antitoxin (ccd killing protein)